METSKPIEVPLNMKCPVCYKSSLKLRYVETNIPYLGKAVIMGIKCENCGFKTSDTILEEHRKKRTLDITLTENNLGDILVVTGYSLIKIPDMGLEIAFKTENVAQITTLEGIIGIFIESLESYVPETEEDKKKIDEIRLKLEKEKTNPSGKLRIVVEDIIGKSVLVPKYEWVKSAERTRYMLK